MTAVVAAALLGLSTTGQTGSVETSAADHREEIVIEVPFVAQGPLLCGGAAAAMVQRFWGARGVYGEDFRHLVREDEGGIRASELTSALERRGYDVRVSQARPERVLAGLGDGIPPILLLESGATRLHYVVLVGVDDGVAWIHDPNFGPSREIAVEELLRRWRASGFWAARVVPSASARDSRDASSGAPGLPPSADSTASSAMARLRAGDFEGARVIAGTLVGLGEGGAVLGTRIQATAWFLEGERSRALEAWNALGEPTIDLVKIQGMRRTRFQVAERRMGLESGDVLTPSSLSLARRRLGALPSIAASRVDYRPVVDGTVEIEASVLERPPVPGYATWVAQVPRGLLNRRTTLEVGPLLAGGDRWRVAGSWEPAQRFVGGSLSAPAPPLPGIATVSVEWRRERFATPGGGAIPSIRTEHRYRGGLEVREWVHARVRLGASLALESWEVPSWAAEPGDDALRLVNAGVHVAWVTDDDRTWVAARGEGWKGAGRSFSRTSVEAGTSIPQGDRREWRLRAGWAGVSRQAPRTIWPGAGGGRTRAALLRAHRLVEDDVIQGPAFGRGLLHATAEHRIFGRVGPFRMGGSLFADAVHAGSRADAAADRGFVDFGVGAFLDTGFDELAVSLARGASGWRLSARVGATSPIGWSSPFQD